MSVASILQGTPASPQLRVDEAVTSGTAGANSVVVPVANLTTNGFVVAYVSVPPAGGGGGLTTTTLAGGQVTFLCADPTTPAQTSTIRFCVLSL